jgi:hypothetical protein
MREQFEASYAVRYRIFPLLHIYIIQGRSVDATIIVARSHFPSQENTPFAANFIPFAAEASHSRRNIQRILSDRPITVRRAAGAALSFWTLCANRVSESAQMPKWPRASCQYRQNMIY